MPPKKKVDPEVLKQQFDEWKTKDEFRIWQELYAMSQEVPKESETSKDLTGKWQPYHDKLYEMVQVFKVKTKLKEFKHEYIRTSFFGQEDKELDKGQIEKYFIDGFHCSVEKEYAAACWNLRKNFYEIFRLLEIVGDLTPDDFQTQKKNLTKSMDSFCKNFAKHIKTGHKHIDEKLQMVLTPLKNLLEINRRLFFFDMKYRTVQERLVNEFVLKAYTTQYCQCLQDCQKILYQFNHIHANPDVKRIFNKLNYKNWKDNPIEAFYLMPLQKSFDKMRQRLLYLMVKGINYFRTPLNTNAEFLEDLKEVINCELIAEHLLGDPLKRDQINFMFKVQTSIFEANPLSKEYLLAKDENSIRGAVPKLVVYMTILHMRNWIDQKQEALLKIQQEKDKLAQSQFENKEEKQQTQTQTGFYLSPEKRKAMDDEAKKSEALAKAAEEERKQQELADMERYGRFWIWEYYCDATNKSLFDECIEMIRHVNPAVRQDIQDEIIREGMIPKKERGSKELKEATENVNKLRQKDNSNVDQNLRRPPELWNFPKIVEEKHDFRSIADPKRCYIDGRIEILEQNIKKLSEHMISHRVQSWNELVDRVVDALKGSYNGNPSAIEQGK